MPGFRLPYVANYIHPSADLCQFHVQRIENIGNIDLRRSCC